MIVPSDIGDQLETLTKKASEKVEKRKRRTTEVLKKKKPKSAKKLTKKERQIQELAAVTVLPDNYEICWTVEQLERLCDWLSREHTVAVDTETMGLNPFLHEIVGVSFYAPDKGWYIPLKHIEDVGDEVPVDVFDEDGNRIRAAVVGVDYVKCLPRELVAQKLKPLLEDRSKKFLAHNGKFDSHILYNWMGIDIRWYFDTAVAQSLLDENKSKRLKDLAPIYLKQEAEKFSTLFGKVTFDKVPVLLNPETRTGCLAGYYAIKDTHLTFDLAKFQVRHLFSPRLEKIKNLFFNVEMPFLQIVLEAERYGVTLDKEYLEGKVAPELHADLERLRNKITKVTGDINLNSPAQLSHVLYEKLKLPRVNPKEPNSTNERTMKMLKKYHPVISDILEYRKKAKLTQAFADKLPLAIVNGRIHTSFNTVGARTGRMSSNSPNLCGAA